MNKIQLFIIRQFLFQKSFILTKSFDTLGNCKITKGLNHKKPTHIHNKTNNRYSTLDAVPNVNRKLKKKKKTENIPLLNIWSEFMFYFECIACCCRWHMCRIFIYV